MSTHSSTSSSNPAAGGGGRSRRWVLALLGLIALFLLSVEGMTRFAFPRISKLQRRMASEYKEALATGRETGGGNSVLIVGNSLLNAAVETDELKRALAPEWKLTRFQVEDTTILDWHYGLRRLFAEGARPKVVLVMLSAPQAAANNVRGEYFAYHLMQASDVVRVSQELKLHPTNACSMLFGHFSMFYGVRAEIRKWLLTAMMPGFQDVGSMMTRRAKKSEIDSDAIHRIARDRIRAMHDLAAQHQAKLIWILPPLLSPEDGGKGLRAAAGEAGVEVLVPMQSGALPASDYSDGFHLNGSGKARFTAAIIPVLRQHLDAQLTAGSSALKP